MFCIKSIFYFNHTISTLSWANLHKVMSMMLTSRYTSPFAYFSTNLETKRQESPSVHTTLIFYTQHFASKKFVISKWQDLCTLKLRIKFCKHKTNRALITYISHMCTMHSTTTHWNWVKQICEVVCPLHIQYLQKCTFRSFQYTNFTSKLLLALEFF